MIFTPPLRFFWDSGSASLEPVLQVLTTFGSEALGECIDARHAVLQHGAQRCLHQAHLSNEPSAIGTKNQMMPHHQVLPKAQLPIEIVT